MRLTVLGCSGTFPGPDSPCSSYLVEADGFRLLVDAGNGALGPLQRHADLLAPDAAIISHLHGDHYLDLLPYTYARRYHPDGAAPALPLHAPSDLPQQLKASFGAATSSAELVDEVYDIRTLAPGRREIGPFALTLARMAHPVECYGMRLEAGGGTLAYSADTGPCDALLELAADTDVLLCEATFGAGGGPPDLHLSGRQAGEYAARAGAGRLLLTHLVPWGDAGRTRDAATAAYAGPVDVVASGDRHEIPRSAR